MRTRVGDLEVAALEGRGAEVAPGRFEAEVLVTGFRSPLDLGNAAGNLKAYMAEELEFARVECVFN